MIKAEELKNHDNQLSVLQRPSAALLSWLREKLSQKTSNEEAIDTFVYRHWVGFQLHPALTRYSEENILRLFSHLSNAIEKQNYVLSSKKQNSFDREVYQETFIRLSFQNAETSPLFQAIDLELILKNQHVSRLKLQARFHHLAQPHASNALEELLDKLF